MENNNEFNIMVALKEIVESLDNDIEKVSTLDKAILSKVVSAVTGIPMQLPPDDVEDTEIDEPEYMRVDLDDIKMRRNAELLEINKIVKKLEDLEAIKYYGSSDSGPAQLYSLKAFFKVVFPDIVPGVLSGFMMAQDGFQTMKGYWRGMILRYYAKHY